MSFQVEGENYVISFLRGSPGLYTFLGKNCVWISYNNKARKVGASILKERFQKQSYRYPVYNSCMNIFLVRDTDVCKSVTAPLCQSVLGNIVSAQYLVVEWKHWQEGCRANITIMAVVWGFVYIVDCIICKICYSCFCRWRNWGFGTLSNLLKVT
jgi:hypothetical protein